MIALIIINKKDGVKMKAELNDLRIEGKNWVYKVKFSDNPYTMVYKNKDLCECLKVKTTINNRLISFLKRQSNVFKTSDLGLNYI